MKTLQSGAMTVQRIAEVERCVFDPTALYPAITPAMIESAASWLDDRFIEPATGSLVLSMHSFVIRTAKRNILIDAGIGNHKRRPKSPWQHNLDTPYLKNLAATGLKPEDIDFVLCTHLHADHVGWNTKLENGRWAPTFPSAKYLIVAEDFDALNRLYQTGAGGTVLGGAFTDSILPLMDARVAQLVEMDHVVEQQGDDGVWLEAMPGHTPGHVAIHAKSGAFHVVIIGDALYHPLQLTEPELAQIGDADPVEAMTTRRRLLHTYADTNTIILPAHFPSPTAGRIVTWGDSYRFRWIER